MASEKVLIFISLVIVTAIILAIGKRHRIKHQVLNRLITGPSAEQRKPNGPEQHFTSSEFEVMTPEEKSTAEFERLQKIIEERKKIAWDTDISYHLWSLYTNHFQSIDSRSLDRFRQGDEWYQVKITGASTRDGVNSCEFELKGNRYTFVDDEEKRGWSDNLKYFSLFLYDDEGHCLIEIPMRIKVDSDGRRYSISSGGPEAFLPGDWIKDFVDVTLKNQSIRNQEIRAQKHQERLSEIEELKARFGISD